MGVLKEINDALKDAKDIAKELKVHSNSLKGTSIARMSSAATLQFPVIMSRSINVDSASAVTKAVERQYAIFVQMVISMNPFLDLSKGEDLGSYINKLHQNNLSAIDLIESCTNVYTDEVYGIYMLTSINEGSNGQIVKSNKDQLFSVEEYLNPNKVNDLYKPANQITLPVAESSLDYFCKKNNINVVTEAESKSEAEAKDEAKAKPKSKVVDAIDKATDQFELNKIKAKIDYTKIKINSDENDVRNQMAVQRRLDEKNYQDIKFRAELDKAEAEYRGRIVVKLADNDVKKANELVPTTLLVTLQLLKGNNFGGNQNFVIGVKGLMHPVNSPEMISNLLDGFKSGNKFFNFIRWTTGEISFLKDLLFNVNGIKDDVIKKHSKGGSHWWTTLKRRKALAKTKNAFGKSKILPNATIVCSMEEIMEMKDAYGVSLMDPKNIKKIMDRYFLLGFVIVDDSQELCYFIFDGESEYQALSFKGLERENSNKNDFKEIYKMINSGRL